MPNELKEGKFNFNDVEPAPQENIDFSKIERFRMEANQTYRIHFIDDSVECIKRHFLPKMENQKGGYFRCTMSSGFCPVCYAASTLSKEYLKENKLTAIKRSSDYFTTSIIVYGTDTKGAITNPKSAKMMLFGFGAEKLLSLKEIIAEYGDLSTLDLGITCTDASFQKFSVLPKKECFYLTDPDFKKIIDSLISNGTYPAGKLAARSVSVKELIDKFRVPMNIIPESFLDEAYPPAARDVAAPASNEEYARPQEQAVPNATTSIEEPKQSSSNSIDDMFADIESLGAIL